MDGEWHALPARLLSEVLRLRGWQVDFLGAQVPTPHLIAHLHQFGPDAVALSCMIPTRLPTAHAAITACQAAGVSVLAFFGGLGEAVRPYSPLVAIGLALVLPPIIAVATKGKYYLRRTDDGIDLPMYDEDGNPSGETLECAVTGMEFERPDMIASAVPGPDGKVQYVSSLALATDLTGEHVLPKE